MLQINLVHFFQIPYKSISICRNYSRMNKGGVFWNHSVVYYGSGCRNKPRACWQFADSLLTVAHDDMDVVVEWWNCWQKVDRPRVDGEEIKQLIKRKIRVERRTDGRKPNSTEIVVVFTPNTRLRSTLRRQVPRLAGTIPSRPRWSAWRSPIPGQFSTPS